MDYKAQDGISSEDLKRIANEQIMEKIKDIARQVYKEEKKKEMEELIKDVIKKAEKDFSTSIKLTGFKMLKLGDGIEVSENDFAAEVAATAGIK